MSVPKPRPSAYLRRIHDQRLQLAMHQARGVLSKKRWQLYAFVSAVVVGIAAIGGAAALLLEGLFR